MENPTYIGDSVYAYYDGNGVELRLERDDAPGQVYLEPDVLARLCEFYARAREELCVKG